MTLTTVKEKINFVLNEFLAKERIYFVEFDFKMNLLAQGLHWVTLDTIIKDLSEKNKISVEDGSQMSETQRSDRIIRISEKYIETAHKERLQK